MQTLKLDTKKQSVKMVFERPGDQNEQALNRKSVEIRHTIDVYTTMKLQFLADRRNYGLAIRLCQSEIFMPQTLRLRFVGRIVEFADVWRFQNVRRCWPRVGIHVQHSPNAICSFRRDVAAPSDILQEVREQTAVVRVQEQPALVSASARQKLEHAGVVDLLPKRRRQPELLDDQGNLVLGSAPRQKRTLRVELQNDATRRPDVNSKRVPQREEQLRSSIPARAYIH